MRFNDDELLRGFEDCSLPEAAWDHRAHIRIAYIYLRRLPYKEALEAIRAGIKAYSAALGVRDTATTGYNETTTCAFVQLVAFTLRHYEDLFPTHSSDQFCDTHPQLLTSRVLRLYYSPSRRTNAEAKRRFLEPDLAPLPPLPEFSAPTS